MLQLTDIHKSYKPETPVISGVDLTVGRGEIVSILGPSGCGKTTLLRIIAGLEKVNRGNLLFAGDELAGVAVHKRNFGLMFQEFALFPHRSVGQNIAFGLRMAKQSKAQIQTRVDEMLALVNLAGYANRSIFELSGGERQRVALARSLAPNPRLLMLDEPLGSLDRALREGLMIELRTILKRVGVTALYVTHDQEEAFAIADRIVLMNRGTIEQIGAPEEVYAHPCSEFSARFLGFANIMPATVSADAPKIAETAIGPLSLSTLAQVGTYPLLIRPDAATFHVANMADASLHGTVVATSFRGNHYQVEISLPPISGKDVQILSFELYTGGNKEEKLTSDGLSGRDLQIGEPISIALNPERLQLLSANK